MFISIWPNSESWCMTEEKHEVVSSLCKHKSTTWTNSFRFATIKPSFAMKLQIHEESPLLPITRNVSSSKCHKVKCCMRSKPACLILLWNFAVLLVFKSFYDMTTYMQANRVLSIILEFIGAISNILTLCWSAN